MKIFFKSCLLIAFAFLALYGSASWAQSNTGNLVKIRILPETGTVKAGDEIWIGIEQSITPHWHTYWKNPGDSGTPTRIEWTVPEGFEIEDIQWPTPKKIPYGPLLNYGYEDNVVLLQKLKIPDNIPTGPLTLSADIELLVCKEECIPEYGTYTLTLNNLNAENENNGTYIQNALKNLPKITEHHAVYSENNGQFILNISDLSVSDIAVETVQFLPEDWGLIENTAQEQTVINDNGLTVTMTRGERPLSELESIAGILTFEDQKQNTYSIALNAAQQKNSAPETVDTPSQALTDVENTSLIQALILAVLGGIILNLMPCVFPVLSIKALSLVKQSEKSKTSVRLSGLAYTAGVILSFLAIAGILIVLKSAGAQIGWGFQLQNPLVVGALAYLVFMIGLNLAGFFEFANPFANTGNTLTQKDGLSGSFFTGVLATLVATPCTAPFMATALGYALIQPAIISLAIFTALGFGLALPYLALCFIPKFQKILPKPGAWMDVFKQFLAFPMFAAAVWLVWVVSQQSGAFGVLVLLSGATLIAFAIWLYTHRPANTALRFILTIVSALAIIAPLGALSMLQTTHMPQNVESSAETFGETFSQEKLDTILSETDNPVFVEMTAAWCITCKVNHATSINIDSTKALFAENNVQYLIGDWTNQDPNITEYLDKYGRNGVPIYVFYGAPENGKRPEAKVLPQILTPQIVKEFVTQ